MDELDVKILRALISEREVAPSNPKVKSSLRALAARLGADDMTVNYRYKKLQESGVMSVWSLLLNPTFFGYRVMEVMVDVQPESGKPDMIRKLKLVNEITGIVDFYGKGLVLFMIYNGDESQSRTIELISRITNAERIVRSRMPLPRSGTKRLTETDLAVVRSLSKDARKSATIIAKEQRLSAKTVRIRIDRLRKENTIFPFPILNIENVPGLIPVYLSYVYTNGEAKASVDRKVLTHFDSSYLTGSFPDPEMGAVVLGASSMADVPKFLEWAKSQDGIASVRVDIATATYMFPEKIIELAELRNKEQAVQNSLL
jgi:DNA-binding Lrp family transcriptional regulator